MRAAAFFTAGEKSRQVDQETDKTAGGYLQQQPDEKANTQHPQRSRK